MRFKSGVITLIDKLEYNGEYANEVTRHGKYDEPIRKLVYEGKLMLLGAIYDFKDIYSARGVSIFIININGETDVDKLRVVGFLAGEQLITDRIKRLLTY